jgi:class 3 adenylate cyclase
MQVASAIEALLLSFALADRFNNYRKEKEALILSQKEMLEQKVTERTSELKKQQQESESLLLNILPAEVAAELKEKGSAKTLNYDAVTVMFTDFKDFTTVVENITPEQLVASLNHCFSAFDKIIEKYGIEKIKTIGDSYMCAGGLSASNPAGAADVVKAGIEIRDFMHEHNNAENLKGSHVFEVRIGIHTGPVIAGIIGIKKFAYDIWGDTVNIASRMESAGDTGKVNISGATYELIKQSFQCVYRGKIPAKNKGEVDMYYVENL